jgi:hypothetical protein
MSSPRATRAAWTLALLGWPLAAAAQAPLRVGPEFPVNTLTAQDQYQAAVAAHADGRFVVVWSSSLRDGDGLGIAAQRYAASGTPVSAEFVVNTFTGGKQYTPAVAVTPAGGFVVVWASYGQDGNHFGVFGQRYDAAGLAQGVEFRVNDYTSSNQGEPSLAVDGSGNFVVVWRSFGQDGAGWGVFGKRYNASGQVVGTEFRVNTYTSGFQQGQVVAADASGNFVVAWSSYKGVDEDEIVARRYNAAGSAVGDEFQVNTFTTYGQFQPAVAMDPDGDFVVVWTSHGQLGQLYDLFGQRYDAAGLPQGAEFQVNAYITDDQRAASVTSDAAGNFVVVWMSTSQDLSFDGVFGQSFDALGLPIGPEFRVNSHTTGSQNHPAVAYASGGRFVVAWTSDGQDGDGYGIFGQRHLSDVIFREGFEAGT